MTRGDGSGFLTHRDQLSHAAPASPHAAPQASLLLSVPSAHTASMGFLFIYKRSCERRSGKHMGATPDGGQDEAQARPSSRLLSAQWTLTRGPGRAFLACSMQTSPTVRGSRFFN